MATAHQRDGADLLGLLDEAWLTKAWHGPTLRGALKGVTASQAGWRPAAGRHNIWEIAVHAAYWKYAVARRLRGGKRGAFPMKGSNWFDAPDSADAAAWRDALAMLGEQQKALRQAVVDWHRAGRPNPSLARHVVGIAFHDIYHAGQIQLLKRLQPRTA